MPSSSQGDQGGLGERLVGEKVTVNHTTVSVNKLLGEGGFAYVYLVKDTSTGESDNKAAGNSNGKGGNGEHRDNEMVLKVTSILSRQQRDIAEKEAKLLSRLSHPSIVKMYDTCYRTVPAGKSDKSQKERAQHLILMEYCDGGHAMEVCTKLVSQNEKFDLSTLIIAFGQICNAVSYLHAQRPPIVHRDLKPENFLIKNGAYKLCDFGSAVFGHVDLKTPKARQEAEEVIEKTTTQMFRAPEMVDLYMSKKLTQATDVWALGCCLYSLAFLKNCFEEGSNLAILSRKYKIPDDNPYGDGLSELIDRMLTEDSKARADMTEVILCLSAVYSGRPLPPRKERKNKDKDKSHSSGGGGGEKDGGSKKDKKKKSDRAGTFRTDGQGIQEDLTINPNKAPKEAKKLDPNSAAARRRQAAAGQGDMEFATFHSKFDDAKKGGGGGAKKGGDQDLAFSTSENPFASFDGKDGGAAGGDGMFGGFGGEGDGDWTGDFKDLSVQERGRSREQHGGEKKPRSRSQDHRRKNRKDKHKDETPEEAIDRLAAEDDADLVSLAETVATKGGASTTKKVVARRGVRRMVSSQPRQSRSLSRGAGLRRTKSGTGQQRASSRKRGDRKVRKDDSDESSSESSSGSE